MAQADEGTGGSRGAATGIGRPEFVARQDRARTVAERTGYDALLVVGRSFYDRPGDLAYLTNHFPPFPTTVFSDANRGMGHALFLLPVAGEPVLLTDPRKHRADLVAVADVRATGDLGAGIVSLLRERALDRARIGLVGSDILPAALDRFITAALPSLRLEPETAIVAGLRWIKSGAELALLRAAARCADAGLHAALDALNAPRATERTVGAAGIAAAMLAGADFVRYFRVHSGPWSASGSRWPPAMDREIADGEVVAMDVIGAHQGYGFDVNRTTVKGRPDDATRTLLEAVHEATARAVAACLPGASVKSVVGAAHAVFDDRGFREHAGSMIGHAIGLETVEEPYLQADSPAVLAPGMVLCVEPGLYVPGWAGASVEQEVVIAADGPPEVITPTPTRLW